MRFFSATMSVTIHTTAGDLKCEIFCDTCPRTSFNFLAMAASGQYNGTIFHRNIRGFMIQGGDTYHVTGKKSSIWGDDVAFPDEFHPSNRHSKRGMVSLVSLSISIVFFCFSVLYPFSILTRGWTNQLRTDSFCHNIIPINYQSMANKGPNTNKSQFFILYEQQYHLDNKHTLIAYRYLDKSWMVGTPWTAGKDCLCGETGLRREARKRLLWNLRK